MSEREFAETAGLVVVGAGPCGIAVGAAARKAGIGTILLDRGPLTSSIVGYPPYMTFFSSAEKLEIEGVPFIVADGKPSRVEALVYYRRVARHFELDVRQHHEVVGIGRRQGGFRVRVRPPTGDERALGARALVVATGGFDHPNLLDVPGEELPFVRHGYSEAHPFWEQRVVVVGGGNSAVEAALELFRAGARVTLVHFAGGLDRGVKPWVLPDITNRLEAGEIDVRWHTRVREIRPGSVVLQTGDAEAGGADARLEELPADHVFALTGWRPDPRLLSELGVPVDPESGVPAHDPETMETPIPGVYIAGVLAAGHDANRIFIENGREHGGRIVRALLERRR